ncbi:unnamed protein product [Prunus brigantina]
MPLVRALPPVLICQGKRESRLGIGPLAMKCSLDKNGLHLLKPAQWQELPELLLKFADLMLMLRFANRGWMCANQSLRMKIGDVRFEIQ